MPLTIDGQANSITSSTAGVNIPATVDTLSVGPSGSYMIANSSGVGIGTLTPQEKVHISNSASTNYIRLDNPSGRSYYGLNSSGDTEVNAATNNNLIFKTFGTERARIDSAGRVTMPYQPAFYAYRTASWTTIPGVVICDNTLVNVGNYYSTSTGRFTAPIAGTYQFTLYTMGYTTVTTYNDNYLRKNGNSVAGCWLRTWTGPSLGAITSMSCYLSLSVGDYVDFYVANGPALYSDGNVFIRFGGHLIG